MSAMRLYHVPYTRSSRVLWALEETGAPFDLAMLTPDERHSEAHRARHPLGQVPVVEQDGGLLFESGALCLHVADSHPQAGLIAPNGTRERALIYQWCFFAFGELEPGFAEFMHGREAGEQQAEASSARFRTAAAVIDDALSGHDYLVADRFTVADIICGELLATAGRLGLTDGLPRVIAYVERLEQRPARRA